MMSRFLPAALLLPIALGTFAAGLACKADPAPPPERNVPDAARPGDTGDRDTSPPRDTGAADTASSDTSSSDPDTGACGAGEQTCGGTCVDPQSNPEHCGDCGQTCRAPTHAEVTGCSAGQCQFRCLQGWKDRNGDLSSPNGDGCEVYDCQRTNRGREACDQKDNDCDQQIDETCTGATTLVGGPNTDRINAVASRGTTLVVGGTTAGPLDGQSASGNFDGFVAKLDPTGTMKWVRVFGAGGSERIDDVAIAEDGSVYAVGSGDSSFGGVNFEEGGFNGQSDAFIVKFDPDGNRQWVVFHGTPKVDFGRAVDLDADGNILLAAQTRDPFAMGNDAGPKGIVAKFAPNGKVQWSKNVGENAADIVTAASGEIYVAGRTGDKLDGRAPAGANDAFVAGYETDGTRRWAGLVGGPKDDRALALIDGPSDAVYLTGESASSFGSSTPSDKDGFVARLTAPAAGATRPVLRWIGHFGGDGDDIGRDILVDRGELLVVGTVAKSVGGRTSAGGTDAVVLNYSLSGSLLVTHLLGTAADEQAYGVTATRAGLRAMVGRTEGSLDGQTNAGGQDGFITGLE